MTHSSSDFESDDSRNEEQHTLGALFSDLTQNVSVLVRQEIELAKTELKESASKGGQGAGMLAGAGIAAHFVLLFLSLAAWVGVAQWLGYGWSALIIAVIWALIAGILSVLGRKKIKEIKGLPETAGTVKKIPSAFTPKEENS
ncbi:phage holin family protein [Arthrobacter sp. MYb213]|uniref:phage holin family protein n=1 Tax=Arthrobacter sp. MYb213 TaxID=1848595 RepID=UPI000CFB01FA|nr:phage holin family protein [Arthrobacter sp. MYb213]PRB72807.1 hypothetical protein CQ011_04060 [Arthrobacter sp. MYb213]